MKEILDRLIEWVNKHGGPTPVALAIGKSPQTFYNYSNRGSKPNMEIFALLANHFEDFDASYILTGIVRVSEESKELERIKSELERREAIITGLLGKSKGANISPDFVIKKHRGMSAKSATQYARHPEKRNVSKPLSVRVQGVKIPSIMDLLQ